ncbi:hypothetical protein NL676_035704 [Syzygium grande]|nr:hypothetical protein NL676_035704 [Syzygium grande]
MINFFDSDDNLILPVRDSIAAANRTEPRATTSLTIPTSTICSESSTAGAALAWIYSPSVSGSKHPLPTVDHSSEDGTPMHRRFGCLSQVHGAGHFILDADRSPAVWSEGQTSPCRRAMRRRGARKLTTTLAGLNIFSGLMSTSHAGRSYVLITTRLRGIPAAIDEGGKEAEMGGLRRSISVAAAGGNVQITFPPNIQFCPS